MSCAQPRMRFVGVWDTVSSLGWIDNPLHLPWESNNPDIEVGRHAVSIDERRAFFRTHLWQMPTDPQAPRGPRDLQQVWFPGVHSDVGGGYPEAESGLSKYALEWMLEEGKAAGLLVNIAKQADVLGLAPDSDYAPARPDARRHESLSGFWDLAEFVPKRHWDWERHRWQRRLNLFRRRTIPPLALVHDSAYLQGPDYQKRIPADAIRVSTRPATIEP